jgi:hypothetical protein
MIKNISQLILNTALRSVSIINKFIPNPVLQAIALAVLESLARSPRTQYKPDIVKAAIRQSNLSLASKKMLSERL